MGRVNTPILTTKQRQELEQGVKHGTKHCFRMRCQSVLLKSEGHNSKDVGAIAGMRDVTVNTWVKRYIIEGIFGLQTKSG